jgi:hypothetical protein
VHFIEGPSFNVGQVLTKLAAHEHFQLSIQQGAVVYTLEDKPDATFPSWASVRSKEYLIFNTVFYVLCHFFKFNQPLFFIGT